MLKLDTRDTDILDRINAVTARYAASDREIGFSYLLCFGLAHKGPVPTDGETTRDYAKRWRLWAHVQGLTDADIAAAVNAGADLWRTWHRELNPDLEDIKASGEDSGPSPDFGKGSGSQNSGPETRPAG